MTISPSDYENMVTQLDNETQEDSCRFGSFYDGRYNYNFANDTQLGYDEGMGGGSDEEAHIKDETDDEHGGDDRYEADPEFDRDTTLVAEDADDLALQSGRKRKCSEELEYDGERFRRFNDHLIQLGEAAGNVDEREDGLDVDTNKYTVISDEVYSDPRGDYGESKADRRVTNHNESSVDIHAYPEHESKVLASGRIATIYVGYDKLFMAGPTKKPAYGKLCTYSLQLEIAGNGATGVMMWYKRSHGGQRRRAGWLREGPKLEIIKEFLMDGRYKVYGTGKWTNIRMGRNSCPIWDGSIKWKVYMSGEAGYTTWDDYETE
ncbi:hypothetical protein BJ508DRAFT_336622 [Ascobolus immersus RN42]|uniref:Uncharacterized protein n=1 Tax=Ascobolus immersus RN42 TaxID=1160509 RepID=A0A3N4HCU6_ASCIM|nr:hypothetical protein BJ508DRAFT_336622 [Ascobolus immersus RN42]